MGHKNSLRISSLFLVAIIIIGGSIYSLTQDTNAIVNTLGERNSYLALFVVAITAGVSVFTTTAYYTFLSTLASSGLEPIVLGLVGASGITLGDIVFYTLGKHGKDSHSAWLEKIEVILSRFVSGLPSWAVPLFAFFYTALGPFPNDILMISSALAGVKLKHLLLPVFVGNTIFGFLLSQGVVHLF